MTPYAVYFAAGSANVTSYYDSAKFSDFTPGQPLYLSYILEAARVSGTATATFRVMLFWYDANGTNMGLESYTNITIDASVAPVLKKFIYTPPTGAKSALCRVQVTSQPSPTQHNIWVSKLRLAKTQIGANNVTDTIELFDGAGHGATSVQIDPPATIVLAADSTGKIKQGELPRDIQLTASYGGSPDKEPSTTVVAAKNGVASLDSNKKVPVEQIPDEAITDVFEVASEAEMLALPATKGDYAIRTDLDDALFLKNAGTSGTLSDWTRIIGSGGGSGGSTSGAFLNRFTCDGVKKTFTVPQGIKDENDAIVTLNGLRLQPVVDYTVAANQITLVKTPGANWVLMAERTGGATTLSLIINCGGPAGVANPLIRINGGKP